MKKLRKYLDLWEEGKTVRGLTVTLTDIRDLQMAYTAITENKDFYFLSDNVKKVLDKCGIVTAAHGIGWVIIQAAAEKGE